MPDYKEAQVITNPLLFVHFMNVPLDTADQELDGIRRGFPNMQMKLFTHTMKLLTEKYFIYGLHL